MQRGMNGDNLAGEGVRWHNGEHQRPQLAPLIAAESSVEDKNAAAADRQRAEA